MCIAETERHHCELEQALSGDKCSLLLIHRHLPISSVEIQSAEIG